MTCEEISTLTRARTRPLQVTVETSGAFVTFAVVTVKVFLFRLFTEAKATRPSTAAAATTPIATLIRVVTVRLPSGTERLIPLVWYEFPGAKVSVSGTGDASEMADRGGFEPPVRI